MSPAERTEAERRILDALDEYRMTDAYQDRLEEAERAQKEAALRLQDARGRIVERILRRMGDRGLLLSDPQRARVMACEDFGQLLDWLDRAGSAATVEDVLAS